MFQINHFYVMSYECIKLAVLSKIKSHPSVVDYFNEIAFYNKPIKKAKIKRLKI